MAKLEKSTNLQTEIFEKLFELGEAHPEFLPSSKEIKGLISEVRTKTLDYNRKDYSEDNGNKAFERIIELLVDNVREHKVPPEEAQKMLYSIQELRNADFDYLLNDYFPSLSNHYKDIANMAKDIQHTLDVASGRVPEEKKSFADTIKNIFNIRKSNESNSNKSKNKPK